MTTQTKAIPSKKELDAAELAEQVLAFQEVEEERIAEAIEAGKDTLHSLTTEESATLDEAINTVVDTGIKLSGANKTLATDIDSILHYMPTPWIDYKADSRMAGWRDVEAIRMMFTTAAKAKNHSNPSKAWSDVKKQSCHYEAPETTTGSEIAYGIYVPRELTKMFNRGLRQELSELDNLVQEEIKHILVTHYNVDISKLDGGDVEEK